MGNEMFKRGVSYLSRKGLPTADAHELPSSPLRFADGAHFRIEIPTINNPNALRMLYEQSKKMDLVINRVSITLGIMRFTDEEIKECLKLSYDYGAEVFMMVGPRARYDIGAQAHINTLNAHQVAYRLRGTDNLIYGLDDALHAIDLGCRGILVCDEGLLYVLNEMRKEGEIPKEVKFKASVLLGTCNVVHARIHESNGADTINIQRDLPVSIIGGFRLGLKAALDVHANNPEQTGGFIRTYEVPTIVRIAAPVYIKTGNIAVSLHSMWVDEGAGFRMAREAYMTAEIIKRYFPEAIQTKPGDPDLALPVLP
jgi:hypothetical protein